jgi:hypothetical protein
MKINVVELHDDKLQQNQNAAIIESVFSAALRLSYENQNCSEMTGVNKAERNRHCQGQ